jgi:hypothetical protein
MSGINLSADEKRPWFIVQAILNLAMGRSNAVGRVTLRPNQTTTVVTRDVHKAAVNVGVDSEVFLTPRTANAAAAWPTTYISEVKQGQFTITHANNAQADKTFGFEARG